MAKKNYIKRKGEDGAEKKMKRKVTINTVQDVKKEWRNGEVKWSKMKRTKT